MVIWEHSIRLSFHPNPLNKNIITCMDSYCNREDAIYRYMSNRHTACRTSTIQPPDRDVWFQNNSYVWCKEKKNQLEVCLRRCQLSEVSREQAECDYLLPAVYPWLSDSGTGVNNLAWPQIHTDRWFSVSLISPFYTLLSFEWVKPLIRSLIDNLSIFS